MTLDLSRRKLIRGLATGIIAAPAIVRAPSIMPVRPIDRTARYETVWELWSNTEVQAWRQMHAGVRIATWTVSVPYGKLENILAGGAHYRAQNPEPGVKTLYNGQQEAYSLD